MCKVLKVHPSGYYAWLKEPESPREKENKALLKKITEAYVLSNRTYGYRNIHKDLMELGIKVNKKRVARLMKLQKLHGTGTVKKKPGHKYGKPHKVHPNYLQQCFIASNPNERWVTDITYIRTHEGWLYLAVILDLFSRKVIGWSMSHRMTRQLALNAFETAVSRRDMISEVILHSDQGSQFASSDWQRVLKRHNVIPSMSRRGNCYDNAVAESFFKTLKKECVRKYIFKTREEAKRKIFEYIEMFYNPKRRHSYLNYLSPNNFEIRYYSDIEKEEVLATNFVSMK
jgi:putative transposase